MSDMLPPPGWYGDPAGGPGSRWWDGSSWTDHVRDRPPSDDPPPPPPEAGAGAGLPPTLPGGKRRTGLILFGALAVGLVAATVVGLRTTTDPSVSVPGDDRPLGQVAPDTAVPAPLRPDEVSDRVAEAGCEVVVDGEPLEDRTHLDPDDALPPDALYPDRPPHSGQHDGQLLPLPAGTATVPIDERAVLHNMEHGSVVVWFDDDLSRQERTEVADWRAERGELGFTSRAGGAIFASPMPNLDDAPTVALRAWGVAVDCERFDPVVADAFLVEHWGSHGEAPEAELSPYPDGSLRIRDRA